MSSDIDVDADAMSRGTATAKGDESPGTGTDDGGRYTCDGCGDAIDPTDTTLASTIIVGACDCGASTRFDPLGTVSVEQAQRWGDVPSSATTEPASSSATPVLMADGCGEADGDLTVEQSPPGVLDRLRQAVHRLTPQGWWC